MNGPQSVVIKRLAPIRLEEFCRAASGLYVGLQLHYYGKIRKSWLTLYGEGSHLDWTRLTRCFHLDCGQDYAVVPAIAFLLDHLAFGT